MKRRRGFCRLPYVQPGSSPGQNFHLHRLLRGHLLRLQQCQNPDGVELLIVQWSMVWTPV